MADSTWIKSRPFDYPYDGQLDPKATALLVIDLQIDFLSEEGYFAKKGYDPARLRAILPTVNTLIDAARAAGCLILYTRYVLEKSPPPVVESSTRSVFPDVWQTFRRSFGPLVGKVTQEPGIENC